MAEFSDKSYLIIEDDEVNVMITEKMIEMVDDSYTSIVKRNGLEAIDFLIEFILNKNTTNLRFIVLDLMMPMMDGFDFLEEYNAKIYAYLPNTSIIVLTSYAHPDNQFKLFCYPFVKHYLEKPLSRTLVEETMLNKESRAA
ncbi:response regulator [Chondrinema litorale]|uniref:response regulator n=1 Tax=Chondrinema litorale TaxID=2994555 RepID=UPI0025432F83|nr:response regulator [Chondrinema litorale]UZR97893.1 response regulator [Chondrinema litorale]